VWHFLVGRFCPHLYLMFLRQVLADDGEPKKSHPLDSYAPNGFLAIQKHPVALVLAITVPSTISGMYEQESLLDKETKALPSLMA